MPALSVDDRRTQAGETHDRVQHEIRLAGGDEVANARVAREDARAGAELLGGILGRVGLRQRDLGDAVLARLLAQALPAVAGREAAELQLLRGRDDLERLLADRPGGPQDEDLLGHARGV